MGSGDVGGENSGRRVESESFKKCKGKIGG